MALAPKAAAASRKKIRARIRVALTLELSGGVAVRLERVVRCHSALRDAVEPEVVKRFCIWIVFELKVAGVTIEHAQKLFCRICVRWLAEGIDEDELAARTTTTLILK